MKRVAILSSCLTEELGRLPGVPTLDWADRCAAVLAKVQAGCAACVVVGSLDARGFLFQVEAVGAGRCAEGWNGEGHPSMVAGGCIAEESPIPTSGGDGLNPLRSAFHVNEWIGWSLGPVTRNTLATTTAGLAGLMRTDSPVWRRWACVAGVGEVVAGVVAVDRICGREGEQTRIALVELALPAQADNDVAAQEAAMASAVLEAVLPLVASKVGAALVTSDRSQWLSTREEEVLWHLLAGESVPDIALKLGRSVYTVHDHVKSLHKKLGLSNRGQLVARALGHIGPAAPTRGGDEPPPPSRSAGTGNRTRL